MLANYPHVLDFAEDESIHSLQSVNTPEAVSEDHPEDFHCSFDVHDLSMSTNEVSSVPSQVLELSANVD